MDALRDLELAAETPQTLEILAFADDLEPGIGPSLLQLPQRHHGEDVSLLLDQAPYHEEAEGFKTRALTAVDSPVEVQIGASVNHDHSLGVGTSIDDLASESRGHTDDPLRDLEHGAVQRSEESNLGVRPGVLAAEARDQGYSEELAQRDHSES